ncbi:GNAT family N-acetyltransferase [Neptunicella sp. SCSIO 80796]|uniref:GNAT family N-acetyltransferase n=1 Tax=Neptunicella plasticusilytica TaxID=3117012 RepID=UPI003A4D6000
MSLQTERLILRQWQSSDRQPFAELNADPDVTEFFPAFFSPEQSDEGILRYQAGIDQRGWGFWAVERKQEGDFIGFVGMQPIPDILPVEPGVEIGWRLAKHSWRKGYASEAARCCLDYGFGQLALSQVFSFTAVQNLPSQGVMQKVGMHDMQQNFINPKVPAGHSLAEHVLYKITREQWQSKGE